MFGSSMLDIAVGVVFIFLLMSVFATAVNEIVQSLMNKRGKYLLKGVAALLNEDGKKTFDLVAEVYKHGQVCGLYQGEFTDPAQDRTLEAYTKANKNDLPAYIPSRNFALALLGVLHAKGDSQAPNVAAASVAAQTAASTAQDAVNQAKDAKDDLSKAKAPANETSQEHSALAQAARKCVDLAHNAVDALMEAKSATEALSNAKVAAAVQAQTDAERAAATAASYINPNEPVPLAIRRAVSQMAHNQSKVGRTLQALVIMAGDDCAKLQKSIEDWYNSGMDRVSGWYKYHTQIWLFWIGVVIAVSLNVNTVKIVRQLSIDPTMRQALVTAAANAKPPATANTAQGVDAAKNAQAVANCSPPSKDNAAQDPQQPANDNCVSDVSKAITDTNQAFSKINDLGLPIGWHAHPLWPGPGAGFVVLLGWLCTAVAISLGAPFWFDMLNKIMVIRSTVKPAEKSGTEGSKDPKQTHS